MILYKYVKPDGLSIIKDLRIKVSNPKDFNDPFEFLPSIIDVSSKQVSREVFNNKKYLLHLYNFAISKGKTNKSYKLFVEETKSPSRRIEILKNVTDIAETLRIKCEKMRAESDEIALIACFCGEAIKSRNEILMWSHYTDGHKGLRIAFNTDFFDIQGSSFVKIKYKLNRVQLNPIDHFRRDIAKIKNTFDRVISFKSSIWSYEKEYRWLVLSESCQRDGKDSFIQVNPKAIVEVVCGAQCPLEQVLLIKNLVRSKLGDGVKIKKAEIDDYKFKLRYVEAV